MDKVTLLFFSNWYCFHHLQTLSLSLLYSNEIHMLQERGVWCSAYNRDRPERMSEHESVGQPRVTNKKGSCFHTDDRINNHQKETGGWDTKKKKKWLEFEKYQPRHRSSFLRSRVKANTSQMPFE